MVTFPLKFKTTINLETRDSSNFEKAISSLLSIKLSEKERDEMLRVMKSSEKDENFRNKE